MKKLLLTSLLILPGLGCMFPNLNSKLPANASWTLSNVVVATPWGTWKADLISSQERQLTNNFTTPFMLQRPAPGMYRIDPVP